MKNKKAQVIGEYVIAIVILVSVMTAMTVYVRRAMQGRIHDAGKRMTNLANNASALPIPAEYEPYYGETDSRATTDAHEQVDVLQGGTTGIYRRNFNETVNVESISRQLPPEASD